MKTIFTVMVLAIASAASASAATCTGTMINRDMVTYVQRGMTVNDISGLLVCAPIEAPGGLRHKDDVARFGSAQVYLSCALSLWHILLINGAGLRELAP